MQDPNLNILDLSPHVFITAGPGISVGVDSNMVEKSSSPVLVATFNRLSNSSYMNKIIPPICLQDQGPALANLQETLWN
jgi:hypothetical protein